LKRSDTDRLGKAADSVQARPSAQRLKVRTNWQPKTIGFYPVSTGPFIRTDISVVTNYIVGNQVPRRGDRVLEGKSRNCFETVGIVVVKGAS